jgi:hypothetical protein
MLLTTKIDQTYWLGKPEQPNSQNLSNCFTSYYELDFVMKWIYKSLNF